jgi:hypothetical protein
VGGTDGLIERILKRIGWSCFILSKWGLSTGLFGYFTGKYPPTQTLIFGNNVS